MDISEERVHKEVNEEEDVYEEAMDKVDVEVDEVVATEEVKECRICGEEDENDRLIKPCVCSGTIAYVHFKCLSQWIQMHNDVKCRICRTQFDVRFDKIGHNFGKFLRADETHRVSLLMTLLFTGFTVFMAIISMKYLESGHKDYDRQVFIYRLLYSSLVLMNFCIFALMIQFWLSLHNCIKEWQKRHFDIVLVQN